MALIVYIFVNNKDVHYNILPNEAPNRFQRKASFGRACKPALEASNSIQLGIIKRLNITMYTTTSLNHSSEIGGLCLMK